MPRKSQQEIVWRGKLNSRKKIKRERNLMKTIYRTLEHNGKNEVWCMEWIHELDDKYLLVMNLVLEPRNNPKDWMDKIPLIGYQYMDEENEKIQKKMDQLIVLLVLGWMRMNQGEFNIPFALNSMIIKKCKTYVSIFKIFRGNKWNQYYSNDMKDEWITECKYGFKWQVKEEDGIYHYDSKQ